MKILLILFALLLLAVSPVAGATSEEETLTRILNEFLAGASVHDAAAHERCWEDDLVYTSSAGLRVGKADILEGLDPDDEAAAEEPEVVYSAEDIRIRQYGDTAVVAFRLLGAGQEYFNTGTFVKREGEWRVVAWQATIIPKPD